MTATHAGHLTSNFNLLKPLFNQSGVCFTWEGIDKEQANYGEWIECFWICFTISRAKTVRNAWSQAANLSLATMQSVLCTSKPNTPLQLREAVWMKFADVRVSNLPKYWKNFKDGATLTMPSTISIVLHHQKKDFSLSCHEQFSPLSRA